MKICKDCGLESKTPELHFYEQKYGFQSYCKDCSKKRNMFYQKKKRALTATFKPKLFKQCPNCKDRAKSSKHEVEMFGMNGKYLQAYCRACSSVLRKRWRNSKPDTQKYSYVSCRKLKLKRREYYIKIFKNWCETGELK